jgi:hypothetical protein
MVAHYEMLKGTLSGRAGGERVGRGFPRVGGIKTDLKEDSQTKKEKSKGWRWEEERKNGGGGGRRAAGGGSLFVQKIASGARLKPNVVSDQRVSQQRPEQEE